MEKKKEKRKKRHMLVYIIRAQSVSRPPVPRPQSVDPLPSKVIVSRVVVKHPHAVKNEPTNPFVLDIS
jgi:hypothetical protein